MILILLLYAGSKYGQYFVRLGFKLFAIQTHRPNKFGVVTVELHTNVIDQRHSAAAAIDMIASGPVLAHAVDHCKPTVRQQKGKCCADNAI